MPAIARIAKGFRSEGFSIFHAERLVVYATNVAGLDEAIAATRSAEFNLDAYIPGLHVAGVRGGEPADWFASWRGFGQKRDLVIHDHARRRSVQVTGAFVSAWSDGSWYDLIIESAVETVT